jgi:hypothetical protein
MATTIYGYTCPWAIKRIPQGLIFTRNQYFFGSPTSLFDLPLYVDNYGKYYITQHFYDKYKDKYAYDSLWQGNPKGSGTTWPPSTGVKLSQQGLHQGDDATIENSVPVYIQ